MTGIFASVLETAKVVPVFKNDSKLDYSNYRTISLLSYIEKILEKIMYKRLYVFLYQKILSTNYSLDSHNNTLHLMFKLI